MSAECPDCTHPKNHHSALVGCLHDGGEPCMCSRSFKETKTIPQARAERDEAMGRAERGTDADWAKEAEKATLWVARIGGDFTPDDIWERLEDQKVPAPREPRALGPVLKRMTNAHLIKPKGFTESRRRHSAPVRVYEAGVNA